MRAIDRENIEIARVLIARGADVNIRDDKSITTLTIACREKDTKIPRLLIKHGANVHAIDRLGGTALKWAAEGGYEDNVKLLIAHGVDLENQPACDGVTPLHAAAREGHEAVVKILIAAGANPNCHDISGRTALWAATRQGHLEIVKLLLQYDVDINRQAYTGVTAISTAAEHSYKKIMRVLLNAGADIWPQQPGPHVAFLDPKDRIEGYAQDAFMEAWHSGNQSAVRLILDAGAKRNLPEYAHYLGVWDRADKAELKTIQAWASARQDRMNRPETCDLRNKVIVPRVYEIEDEKRKTIAEQLGIEFIDSKTYYYGGEENRIKMIKEGRNGWVSKGTRAEEDETDDEEESDYSGED